MTDKGPYRRFKFRFFPVAFAAAWAACGSAQTKPDLPAIRVDPRAALSSVDAIDGSILLLSVQLPAEAAKLEPRAKFEETEIPLFAVPSRGPGSYEAVVGVAFGHAAGRFQVNVTYGEGATLQTVAVPFDIRDGNYASEQLKVDNKFFNPSKRDLKRIDRDKATVGAVYRTVTKTKYWTGPFALPIQSPVTSPFGTKRVFNGEMKSFHQGLDLKATVGTPIHAAAPGVVAMAKDLFFTGNTVLLDHGYGVITLYAHMSKLRVKKGQVVKSGQLLGLAGQTGRVSGPHLHWGAIIHRAKVNPMGLTQVMR